MLGNGPHVLGIMSHSGLCPIRDHVTIGIMSFGLCRILGEVVRDYVAFCIQSFWIVSLGLMCFSVMSFGIMSLYQLVPYCTAFSSEAKS